MLMLVDSCCCSSARPQTDAAQSRKVEALDPFLPQTAVASVCNMTSALLWETIQNIWSAPTFVAVLSLQNFALNS